MLHLSCGHVRQRVQELDPQLLNKKVRSFLPHARKDGNDILEVKSCIRIQLRVNATQMTVCLYPLLG